MKQNSIPTLSEDRQVYGNYTEEDQQVWHTLFTRQMAQLPGLACHEFMEGIKKAGFTAESVPEFSKLNEILGDLTGWEVVAVPGIVDDRTFFELMSNRKFPATTWLRSREQLDYLEEPDMFHDIFAHVPLLTNPEFASFLEQISKIGMRNIGDQEAIELLSRIYWFTVEFGLIREKGQLRIYGAGILSSSGESKYAVGMQPMHFEYNVEQILNTTFRKDIYQDRYYITDSLGHLFESVAEIEELIHTMLSKRLRFA